MCLDIPTPLRGAIVLGWVTGGSRSCLARPPANFQNPSGIKNREGLVGGILSPRGKPFSEASWRSMNRTNRSYASAKSASIRPVFPFSAR